MELIRWCSIQCEVDEMTLNQCFDEKDKWKV
jgi:hypothetical protein